MFKLSRFVNKSVEKLHRFTGRTGMLKSARAELAEPTAAQIAEGIVWKPTGDVLTRRQFVAQIYLRGDGIEIGALHNPLQVPPAAQVKYVDRLSVAELRRHYPELTAEALIEPDIICDGEELETIPNASQDFVIANHFIEHCQNPIKAFGNMLRVLRPEGILYLAIPDKRYTFDRTRPLTTLDHVRRDYQEGPEWSRRGHFEETVHYCALEAPPDQAAFDQHVQHLLDINYSIHYHVWTPLQFFELLVALRSEFSFEFEVESFFRNEGEAIYIIRKGEPAI